MRAFIIIFTVAILTGCVGPTVPVQGYNGLTVPPSTWRTQNYRVPGENTGLLLLQRDTGMRGAACKPGISLDGEDIARIDVGQKLEIHLNAGRYLVRANPNPNCAASVAETYVEIAESGTTAYRLGFVDRQMILVPAGQ
tara:strand:- start:29581 stop:29997 length:417 start_codon:yes stop_codon:yes gene_type:complete